MAEPEPSKRQRTVSRLEAWVAALGALLVLAALGFLVVRVFTDADEPGGVRLTVQRVQRVEGGWLVRFEAHNEGTATLAGLHVQGRLRLGPVPVETSEAELDYVPGRSRRAGGLYFTQDPARHTLELVPRGYQDP